MSIQRHDFTDIIISILDKHHRNYVNSILENSEIIQYLNIKTKAAHRGSKSRSGFANHYAIYVLIEDYLNGEFHIKGNYVNYEGAKFTNLLRRQRELLFGSKLQNHALNHRLNEEFKKFFPLCEYVPIIRDAESNRYWINEKLIITEQNGQKINLAVAIKEIINIPKLIEILEKILESGKGTNVLEEIVLQSRVEFNVESEEQDIVVFNKVEADVDNNL